VPPPPAQPGALRSDRRLPRPARQTVAAFEEHVADIPNVLQAQRLFGDPDYLLRVVARDLPAYRQLYDERLATLPGVLRLSSTLVMKSVVDARPLPL
jgi:DNA-binding Lrp family transcriptional regulator